MSDPRISAADRWRLILGQEREKLARSALPPAIALDDLYGFGRGEGARGRGGAAAGSGFPSVRSWAEELEALFGREVREEVLGRAAARGQTAAALEVEAESVSPSVELLQQMLSLKGGLAEDKLLRLRRLVDRIVGLLITALAVQVRPALTGMVSPRPSRRRTGPLDLGRTIRANLRTARRQPNGTYAILPDQPIFRTRVRRSLDWRVILVVDVSGSMEESVIYSALMAAIIGGLPAVTAHFVAFSTEIVDLSDHVTDPLGLLLEIEVGGGTLIAHALRYARGLVRVPARTIVVLVSDFEEGGPVGALLSEVRSIVDSGAHLLGLAALDDRGKPRYSLSVAEQVVAAGMPVAALTPLELARWLGEKIGGRRR